MSNTFNYSTITSSISNKLVLLLTVLTPILTQGIDQVAIDTLKIGYYHSPPFVEVGTDGKLTGVSVWLWDQIKQEDKYHYQYHKIPLNQQPLQTTLNKLKNGDIDLSLSPLTITSKRNKDILFSQPYFVSNLAAVQNKSSSVAQWKDFISSFFSAEFVRTLLALLSLLFIFGLIIWLFERKSNPEQFNAGPKGILNGLWWSAVTMTTVGYGDKYPKTWGGKIVALIWMFTAIVVISSFTASIASSLTINKLTHANTDLDGLKDKKVGTVYGSATEEFLNINLFKKVKPYKELSIGLTGLKNKDVDLFIYDEPYLQYHIDNRESLQDLEFLPFRFNVDLYAFAFNNDFDSKLLQHINQQIIEVKETRQWEYVLNEYNLSEL